VNIRDRIKELRRVPADQLQPNPKNWRKHPEAQANALRGVLAEVGIASAVLARETPEGGLMLIDGHLRTETLHNAEIPVLVLDVSEEEADKILATFDPLGAMAESDADALRALLEEVETGSQELADMLTALAEDAGVFNAAEAMAPDLADGDREPFQQMTFTLHDSQVEILKRAMEKAKAEGDFSDSPNENSNGNALTLIAEAFCG
jgi:ParB-like chromosome segregation protein Spo0J